MFTRCPMARQLVNHGHVRVNGHRVNIPSYLVREGEVIAMSPQGAQIPGVQDELDTGRQPPRWLDRPDTEGRVLRAPERDDVEMPIQENLIVEYYSR